TASIGKNSGSEGHVTVDGGSLQIEQTYLGVGHEGGTGTLTLSNGGTASLGGIVVGYFSGTGAATVAGNGSQMNVIDKAYLGYYPNTSGELNVQSGGAVSVAGWME